MIEATLRGLQLLPASGGVLPESARPGGVARTLQIQPPADSVRYDVHVHVQRHTCKGTHTKTHRHTSSCTHASVVHAHPGAKSKRIVREPVESNVIVRECATSKIIARECVESKRKGGRLLAGGPGPRRGQNGAMAFGVARLTLRGAKGVQRKGVWTSVDMRVWTCKELRVNRDQTSCYLRPPFLGTPWVPFRLVFFVLCAGPEARHQASDKKGDGKRGTAPFY